MSANRMKMFLDTNLVRNKNYTGPLFGSLEKLQSKAELVDIVVPEIVIEEILDDKRNNFKEQKEKALQSVKSNCVLKSTGIKIGDIEPIEYIPNAKDLINQLPFDIEVIKLKNSEIAFAKVLELAVNHKPPFESEGDKGFKDAIIAMTIDEYLDEHKMAQKSIIFTNDKLLGEYYDERENIVVVENFKELDNAIRISPTKPKTTNIAGQVSIIESPVRKAIRDQLTALRNAGNFTAVHEAISHINGLKNKMTDEDFIDTLISATNNNQIYWIREDQDIQEYYDEVFRKYGNKLSDEDYNKYIAVMGLDKSLIRQPRSIIDDLPF